MTAIEGKGMLVIVSAPSGAGKTTLLWHLAGLLKPTAGTVEVGGRPLSGFSARALTSMRLREVGLLLQNPASNLLPSQSASCASKRRRCSAGSFSSLKALATSKPPMYSSNRSTVSGSSGFCFDSGETSVGKS